eukprot:656340-Pleurochrysis_carterae.AAC.4
MDWLQDAARARTGSEQCQTAQPAPLAIAGVSVLFEPAEWLQKRKGILRSLADVVRGCSAALTFEPSSNASGVAGQRASVDWLHGNEEPCEAHTGLNAANCASYAPCRINRNVK